MYLLLAFSSLCLLLHLLACAASSCPLNGPPSNAQWRLTTSVPSGCTGVACSYFLAIRTNEDPRFLDFMMEGSAQGWIAVGYTPNRGMPDADVFACAVVNSHVAILDTYNIPNNRINVFDASQDLCPFNSSFINGRISCLFSRAIRTNDSSQDKDLSIGYYQLSGGTSASGSTAAKLVYHGSSSTPAISSVTVVPSNSSSATINTVVAIDPLIRAHGILMIVAWPVLAVSGIFFAAWMKPVLLKGWFQVHRALMLASLFFGCAAFLFAFVGKRDTKGLVYFGDPSTVAHFAIGIGVMALHVINPIVSAFRCKPDAKKRWIFNIIHGTAIGLGAELLALVNVGLGLSLFGNKLNLAIMASPLATYLAYATFLILIIASLFFASTISAVTSGSPTLAPSVLKPLFAHSKHDPSDYNKLEVDESKTTKKLIGDPCMRWAALIVFFAVMLPLMLAVIIHLAIL